MEITEKMITTAQESGGDAGYLAPREVVPDMLEAALSAAPVAVKVKQLEWFSAGNHFNKGDIFNAELYSAYIGDITNLATLEFDGDILGRFVSLDEAKATAQADYEQRILSALEPIPDSASRISALEAEVGRLREALENISSPTQTTDLLWWQIEARAALADKKVGAA